MIAPVLHIVIAYLIGSIAFGIVVSKCCGIPDPRTIGSNNPGATNVARSGNKFAAVLTLLCDFIKGWGVVWFATHNHQSTTTIAWSALAVFLGHLYPVYYKFRGGKGVATGLGVWYALSPNLAYFMLVSWLITFGITRYSSLSAIVATVLGSLVTWIVPAPTHYRLLIVVLAGLILWKHRTNMHRLWQGTESKF